MNGISDTRDCVSEVKNRGLSDWDFRGFVVWNLISPIAKSHSKGV
jgi:hypothetical protein